MFPQTIGALAGFLALVAPGLAFTLLRERRRPTIAESTFREIAIVALTSLLFTAASMIICLLVFRHIIVDPTAWAKFGATYAREQVYRIGLTVAIEVAVAVTLAWVVSILASVFSSSSGRLAKRSLWHQIFRKELPKNAVPWLHIQLDDDSSFFGHLYGSTAAATVDQREIVLEGRSLIYRPARREDGSRDDDSDIGTDWEFVTLKSADIKYVKTQYLSKIDGTRVLPRRRIAEGRVGMSRRRARRSFKEIVKQLKNSVRNRNAPTSSLIDRPGRDAHQREPEDTKR